MSMKEYMDWWRETSEAYIEAVEEKHQQEKRAEKKHTIRKWIADNAVALVALAVAILKQIPLCACHTYKAQRLRVARKGVKIL